MHWSFIPDKLFIRNFSLLFFFLQSNNDDLVKKMLCEASHSFRTWQLSIHFQSFNKSQMPASLTDQVRVLAFDWMIHWRGHVGGGGGVASWTAYLWECSWNIHLLSHFDFMLWTYFVKHLKVVSGDQNVSLNQSAVRIWENQNLVSVELIFPSQTINNHNKWH